MSWMQLAEAIALAPRNLEHFVRAATLSLYTSKRWEYSEKSYVHVPFSYNFYWPFSYTLYSHSVKS